MALKYFGYYYKAETPIEAFDQFIRENWENKPSGEIVPWSMKTKSPGDKVGWAVGTSWQELSLAASDDDVQRMRKVAEKRAMECPTVNGEFAPCVVVHTGIRNHCVVYGAFSVEG